MVNAYQNRERYDAAKAQALMSMVDASSPFWNFWNNIYKYTGEFSVPGFDDEKLKMKLFHSMPGNVTFLNSIISFYWALAKGTHNPEDLFSNIRLQIEGLLATDQAQFAHENGQINVEEICKMFDWALSAFIKGGNIIGRKPNIAEGQKVQLVQDFREICIAVNQYRLDNPDYPTFS